VRSELLARIHRLRPLRCREVIRSLLSLVVSGESVQIARSVQRDVLGTVETALHAALEAATVEREESVQTDLNASGPIDLNASVDSDGATASTEINASSARAARVQAGNGSTTDESAKVVSEDLATHTVQRARGVTHGRKVAVTSVVVGRVRVLTIVVTVALSVVTTGSADALTSSVVANPLTVADSHGIGSSPLRDRI
jgi:post-segregation antitoxin (ccd killing protein)